MLWASGLGLGYKKDYTLLNAGNQANWVVIDEPTDLVMASLYNHPQTIPLCIYVDIKTFPIFVLF